MGVLENILLLSQQLIPIMLTGLAVALIMRYLAFRSGRFSQTYFNSFSRSVYRELENEEHDKSQKKLNQGDIDVWLNDFLEKVVSNLPERSIRFSKNKMGKIFGKKPSDDLSARRSQSLSHYTSGRSIFINLKQQSDAFKSSHQPDFSELSIRVLQQDSQWKNLLGFIPIEALSRVFDILPGLFVIGGIFGTFLGITSALPKIATIDIKNLEAAAPILSSFVADVAFSMNTSLVGIVCSVIVTILIAIFPLDGVRKQVMENMEQALEQIWYRIHGDNIAQGDQMIIEELRHLREEIKLINKSRKKGKEE